MDVGAESSRDNDVALASATQAFFFDEALEAFENARVNIGVRCFQSLMGYGYWLSY